MSYCNHIVMIPRFGHERFMGDVRIRERREGRPLERPCPLAFHATTPFAMYS